MSIHDLPYLRATEAARVIIDESMNQGAVLTPIKLLHLLYAVQGFSMAIDERPLFIDTMLSNVGNVLVWIDSLIPTIRERLVPNQRVHSLYNISELDMAAPNITDKQRDIIIGTVRRYATLDHLGTHTLIRHTPHSAIAAASAIYGDAAPIDLQQLKYEFTGIINRAEQP